MSAIPKTKYTSQYIDNMSFDEGLGVKVFEIVNPDGSYANLDAYPSGSGSNGTVTLTSASTAYAVPATASTKKHLLVIYNGSDTDMYWGFATLTSGGILLPAGGTLTVSLGADKTLFLYCGSAGKVVNYSYLEV